MACWLPPSSPKLPCSRRALVFSITAGGVLPAGSLVLVGFVAAGRGAGRTSEERGRAAAGTMARLARRLPIPVHSARGGQRGGVDVEGHRRALADGRLAAVRRRRPGG